MRNDQITKKFLAPETLERISRWAFFIGCVFSFAPLLELPPKIVTIATQLFIITTVVIFVLGYIVRLWAMPSAEEGRVTDFMGRAYKVNISPTPTTGYYTGGETAPERRAASQLLENLLFTKTISGQMVKLSRWLTVGYLVLWLAVLLTRDVQLGWIVAVTQVIFSEEIIARYIRLEWLRHRTEKLYDEVYRIVGTKQNQNQFSAQIFEKVCIYERIKATAGVILCSKTFEKLNPSLSAEWVTIQQQAGLQP